MKTLVLKLVIGLSSYFPAVVFTTSLVLVGLAVHFGQVGLLAAAVLNLYLTPLITYRVFHLFVPVHEGIQIIWPPQDDALPTWFVGHKIQLVYGAMPILEHVLVLFPGLYALWIRLWGGKVGRGTNFTPQIEITDRGLVDIGADCFFGHRVFMSSHLVTRRDGQYVLYVRRIRIGDGCFVGAMCKFGPGTDIAGGSFVPLSSYTIKDDTEPRLMIK